MEVKLKYHAKLRLRQKRQIGVTEEDCINLAVQTKGKIHVPMKYEGFAESGRRFKIVIVDCEYTRWIITIVGQERWIMKDVHCQRNKYKKQRRGKRLA